MSVVTKTGLGCDSQHLTMMTIIKIIVNQKLKIIRNEDSGEVSLVDSDILGFTGASSL